VKKPREEATARDEVQWRMQFEKHQFAWLERLKIGCRRWTPEIDFFHLRAGCVEIKPVLIRYGNEYSHSWCRSRVYSHQTTFGERSSLFAQSPHLRNLRHGIMPL
jgi:hypothetical protein